MTLLAAIASGAIVVSLVLAEGEKYVNIMEALFTDVKILNTVNKGFGKRKNWKKAYV